MDQALGASARSRSLRFRRAAVSAHAVTILHALSLAADRAKPPPVAASYEPLSDGLHIVIEDVKAADWHIHQVLYGLIKAMMEQATGRPLGEVPEATTITNAPHRTS